MVRSYSGFCQSNWIGVSSHTDIMLEPPISSLQIKEPDGFVIKVDPSSELFLYTFDIITTGPIGPLLKLE